jgi:hypothetical protein
MVRNGLGEVRKRLALYFGEHPEVPVRIDLPLGSYTAEFLFRHHPAQQGGPEAHESDIHVPVQRLKSWTRLSWFMAAGLIGLAAISLAVFGMKNLAPASPLDRFWGPLLRLNQQVLISLGTPFDQAPPQSAPDDAFVKYMYKLPNNPVPDITAANSINQFLSSRGAKPEIRMAHSIQLSDLHTAPAVLIGASPMNPWTERLGSDLRFQFRQTAGSHVHSIVDTKNPSNSSWQVNIDLPYEQISRDYALISRQLSTTTGQWWIGIGGTTAISTSEAERLVLDPSTMKSIEAQLPRGWDERNVQIVMEFTLVNGSAGGPRVVASNLW